MKAIDLLEPGALFRGALFADLARASVVELAAGAHLGVFRVVRELARGGMGVVYLAERDDGQYTQRVALKIVGGARVSNEVFKRERQILADLRHPNIARLVDGGQDDAGRPWLAMELIEGARLDQHCLAQMARFKRPKRYEFVAELPKNNYGKVLKTALRERLTPPRPTA